MPTFFENENVSVQFIITRAYPTPQYVQNSYGIMANFSAAIVLNAKSKGKIVSQTRLAAINNLTIKVGRDTNIPFVGSDYKKVEIKDDNGQVINNKAIYYFSLFPGSNYEREDENEDLAGKHDRFVDELCKEISEFVQMAQKRAETRKDEPAIDIEKLPRSLQAIRALSPAQDKEDKNDKRGQRQKVATGDIPF